MKEIDTLKYLKFLRRIYKNLFIWRYNKREYEHLSNLFQKVKKTEILDKSIIFNTVRCFKNILDRELFIAKILALNGASVTVLLDDGVLKHWDTIKVDSLQNVKDIEKMNYNLFPIFHKNLKNIVNVFFARINLKRALRTYKDKNLIVIYYSKIIKKVKIKNLKELEKYAKSSTIRYFKTSELDFTNENVNKYYKISLINSLLSRKVGEFVLNELNPDYFVTSHGIYSTWGPAFDFLKKNGITSYVYAGKHSHSEDIHDIYFTDSKVQTLSGSTFWKNFRETDVTKSMEEKVKTVFEARMSHNTEDTKIYYEGKTNEYQIDSNDGYQYHIAIFPNLIWDGNIEDRHIAFNGIMDWLISTLEYLKNRKDIKIYVKFHPAEITLFKTSPKISDLLLERIDINEYENLVLIPAQMKIDPYQFLLSGIDFAICYDGFLALEIPYLKIPTLLGGVGGRFSVKGGNFTISNREEYFSYLDRIDKLIDDFRENYLIYYNNIIRYSYWYLFGNIIKLQTLSKKSLYETNLFQVRRNDLIVDEKIINLFLN